MPRWIHVSALATVLLVAGCTAWDGRVVSTPTPSRSSSSAPAGVPTSAVPRPPKGTTTPDPCRPGSITVPKQPPGPAVVPSATDARRLLGELVTARRGSGATYCRSAFGPPEWLDLDRNGCTSRQDTLVGQAVTVRTGRIRSHGSTCEEALSGRWRDAYTGRLVAVADLKDSTQAQLVQVDHLVSLYEAWVSGAAAWSPQRRIAFAHDVRRPELWAVSAATNLAKAHRGADSWAPKTPALRCRFGRSYVAVKAAYDLTVTATEREALAGMLADCP